MRRLTMPEAINYIISQLNGGTYDYILNNCQFPHSCSPDRGQLVFSTDGRFYTVYLDGNVIPNSRNLDNNPELRRLLENGSVTFATPEDMMNYFRTVTQENTGSTAPRDYMQAVDVDEVQSMYKASQDHFLDPDELAKELKKDIFGQDEALEQISEKLAIHMLRKENRLFSTILFGKTGTGKSSLANALPKALTRFCGKEYGFIEIAGNELPDSASMTRFFGAPPEYVGHGQPTFFSPIKDNPYTVVVINEIEKATDDLFTRLMECLDTSSVKLADNTCIDLSHCIFIFTSNLPIDTGKFSSMNRLKQAEYLRDAFTRFCHKPEIAARIGSYCVFKDLDMNADISILSRDIAKLLQDFGLELKEIDSGLLVELLKNKSSYGARAHLYTIEETIGRYLIRHRELRDSHQSVILKGTLDELQIEAA